MQLVNLPKTPNRSLAQQIMRHYEQAKSDAMNWHSLYEEAYDYTQPYRGHFTNQDLLNYGEDKGRKVYDTTAVRAKGIFASQVNSTMTPPFSRWISLEAGELVPKAERESINSGLQDLTNLLFSMLNRTNFNDTVYESYKDLSVGMFCLAVYEGFNDGEPFRFYNIPVRSLYPAEAPNGIVENFFCDRFRLTIHDILQIWPNSQLPNFISSQAQDNELQTFDLIEGQIFDPTKANTDRAYFHFVLEPNTQSFLVSDFSPSKHFIISRWEKSGNDAFGIGPGITALPSIKTLNKMYEYTLMGASLSVAPPLLAYSSDQIDWRSKKITPHSILQFKDRPMDGQKLLEPLITEPNVQFGEFLMNDLRQQINNIFYAQPIGSIEQNPKMTATEVLFRKQLALEEKGPAYDRLFREFIRPLIDRLLYLLSKRGIVGQHIKVDGRMVEISYDSPLSSAQKLKDVQNFEQAYQTIQGIYGPQLAPLTTDPSKVIPFIEKNFNAKMDLFATSDQIQAMMKQMAQRQEQQAQLEALQQQPQQQAGAL